MTRIRYGSKKTISSFGRLIPSTLRNRRIIRRQNNEVGRAFSILILHLMQLFIIIAVTVIFLFISIIPIAIFLIVYVIKILYRIVYYKIKKKKLTKDIFIKTKFEEKFIVLIKNLPTYFKKILSNSMLNTKQGEKNINRKFGLSQLNRTESISSGSSSTTRYCEICGGRLGRGRIKYCSDCRPTYRPTPYEDDDY